MYKNRHWLGLLIAVFAVLLGLAVLQTVRVATLNARLEAMSSSPSDSTSGEAPRQSTESDDGPAANRYRRALSFMLGRYRAAHGTAPQPHAPASGIEQADVRKSSVSEIRDAIAAPGVRSFLRQHRLVLSPTPRSEGDFVYFDLSTFDGRKLGALAVKRYDGEVWVTDEDDVPIRSLHSFARSGAQAETEAGRAARKPRGSPGGSEGGASTFLLAGTHARKTDALMLASLRPETERLKLLSIPRDLYTDGERINTAYADHGPEGLRELIESVTGVAIDHYIVIDMYAFIEAVNVLGGVTVTLDEPLRDPSYRIKEHGRWDTLSLEAGTHHLDGRAALRVARSRHTSSDFARARRQQRILASLTDRLRAVGLNDMDTVLRLGSLLLRYVDTDLSLFRVVHHWRQLAEVTRVERAALSTENVLRATYSAVHAAQQRGLPEPKGEARGAWILVPKDDDWARVRRYIARELDLETGSAGTAEAAAEPEAQSGR
jgi:LCP family protein required for cell wall assembly